MPVHGLPAHDLVAAVAGGFAFSLALTAHGRLYAWGDNTFGELGRETHGKQSLVPVPIQ